MAVRKLKQKDVDYLEAISDLAEAIELNLKPGPVLKKHKAVIDKAYSYMIIKDLGAKIDLVKAAKKLRTQKWKKERSK
jgi:hypothetical protein